MFSKFKHGGAFCFVYLMGVLPVPLCAHRVGKQLSPVSSAKIEMQFHKTGCNFPLLFYFSI